jgi:MYXO-CTERM domain-containing protein
VRTGNDNLQGDYVGSMSITYKVQDTSAPMTGSGSFSIAVPAPGAVALAGLAGLTGRRRR